MTEVLNVKKRTGFIVVSILLGVGVGFGQTTQTTQTTQTAPARQARTITNLDLEKYRQERVRAEDDYRANYEKLGLPSPEELEKRRIEDAKVSAELAARLRYEREFREYAQAQQAASANTTIYVPQQYYITEDNYRRSIYGYIPYYNYAPVARPRYGNYPDWRATPGGVVYEPGGRSSNIWSPNTTKPAPAFKPVRPR